MTFSRESLFFVKDLEVFYDEKKILNKVSFELYQGNIFLLLGSSGSGKTTLLRSCLGLQNFSKGVINWDVPDSERSVAFQTPSLFPHLTAFENVNLSEKHSRGDIEILLERFGILPLKGSYPHEMSQGEQQRVSLARAFIGRPRLVVLDEPFAHLDVLSRESLSQFFVSYAREHQAALIFTEHHQDQGLAIANRIGLLNDSRLETWENFKSLLLRPSPYAVQFLKLGNLISVKKCEGGVKGPLGFCAFSHFLKVPEGDDFHLFIPWKAIKIEEEPQKGRLSCRVENISCDGVGFNIYLRCVDKGIDLKMRKNFIGSLKRKDLISLSIDFSKCTLIEDAS